MDVRCFVAAPAGRESPSLRVSLRPGHCRPDLLHDFPLMLPVILLLPLLGAIAIIAGAPARRTAMFAAMLTLLATVALFAVGFTAGAREFQFVTSVPINAEWGLSFTLGVDGLSLVMVILTALVLFAAVWFAGEMEQRPQAFYAC